MPKKELLSFYELQYRFEIERRDKIDSRLQTPFAIIIGLMGVISYMLQNISHKHEGMSVYIFWLLFFCTCTSLLVAFYFFRKAWFGYNDLLIPTPRIIENYRAEIADYYRTEPNGKKKSEEHIENTILKYYIDFASQNSINNDARAYNIYRTTVSLTFAVVFAVITYIPLQFFDIKKSDDGDIYKVEITNIKNKPTKIIKQNNLGY